MPWKPRLPYGMGGGAAVKPQVSRAEEKPWPEAGLCALSAIPGASPTCSCGHPRTPAHRSESGALGQEAVAGGME